MINSLCQEKSSWFPSGCQAYNGAARVSAAGVVNFPLKLLAIDRYREVFFSLTSTNEQNFAVARQWTGERGKA